MNTDNNINEPSLPCLWCRIKLAWGLILGKYNVWFVE